MMPKNRTDLKPKIPHKSKLLFPHQREIFLRQLKHTQAPQECGSCDTIIKCPEKTKLSPQRRYVLTRFSNELIQKKTSKNTYLKNAFFKGTL